MTGCNLVKGLVMSKQTVNQRLRGVQVILGRTQAGGRITQRLEEQLNNLAMFANQKSSSVDPRGVAEGLD